MQKTKKGVLIIATGLCVGSLCFAAGCKKGTGPQFLEGAYTEVVLGESVLIDEFVDFGEEEDYDFTITDVNGESSSYASLPMWTPEEIGVHTMTYTINSGKNKGTATYEVEVVPYDIEWEFDNAQSITVQRGEPIVFDTLINGVMNMSVQSYCDYEVKMVSVTVDGVKTEFTDETSYTPTSLSDHVFRFRVTTEDGQKKEATVIIHIQYIDEAMTTWFEENDITYHKYLLVTEGSDGRRSVGLDQGELVGKTAAIGYTDLPYIAYNGEYGAGDYVTFDFTGNNMPQVCFFADEVTSDLADGANGMFIFNGLQGSANYNHRRIFYGPHKIKCGDTGRVASEGGDALKQELDCLASKKYLDENTKYRFITGISDVSADYKSVTIRSVLCNIDTGDVVYASTVALDVTKFALTEAYFKGSIVAYGDWTKRTTWDNVYPVFENVTDIYSLAKSSQFADGFESTVRVGETLAVNEYINPEAGADYELYYVNADGERTEISGTTFSFAQKGEYTLYYRSGNSTEMAGSLKISVLDMTAETAEWLQTNNIEVYGATEITDTHSVTLKAGSYVGSTHDDMQKTDAPYVAFTQADGSGFGVGDSLAFDFTGANLPNISFFNDKITTETKNFIGTKGFFFTGGIAQKDGYMDSNGQHFKLFAPNKMSNSVWSGTWQLWKVPGVGEENPETEDYVVQATVNGKQTDVLSMSYWGLTVNPARKYRCIVSITDIAVSPTPSSAGEEIWKVGMSLLLIDLSDNSEVFKISVKRNYVPNRLGNTFESVEDFKGNIILYGRPYQETKIDKIYPIFEGQMPSAVRTQLQNA